MPNTVCFYLNGQSVTLENPSPDLLLIDYLRSPSVSLSGAKKGCGQGGCGACTVILSEWDNKANCPEHRSINSCLRAVCSLQGKSVTTVEGTSAAKRLPPSHPKQALAASRGGAPIAAGTNQQQCDAHQASQQIRLKAVASCEKRDDCTTLKKTAVNSTQVIDPSINPVAYRLAVNNGSQCGYCSTGFVMNMSAFLANHPSPTKKQIEAAFDGNICRCTGYRPILTAMKTFAVDWSKEDEANRMKCLVDDQVKAQQVGNQVVIPFPEASKQPSKGATVESNKQQWYSPGSIDELLAIYQASQQTVYMLHANTAYGIYPEDFHTNKTLVNISHIPELHQLEQQGSQLSVGAGVTYTQFLATLDAWIKKQNLSQTTAAGALQFMAHRTAGTIVRNAATLAGNSMLVLKHIAQGSGEPFPSDLFTVLSALNVEIEYLNLTDGKKTKATVNTLLSDVIKTPTLASQILLLTYGIDLSKNADIVLAQKIALRDINAHSIVNSTSIFNLQSNLTVETVNLTFGAIAPYPWRATKTEALLTGKPLSLSDYPATACALSLEVQTELDRWKPRMAGLPDEGFTDTYKTELATAFVYKAMVNALLQTDPAAVPAELQSSGEITWGHWPVSDGIQSYSNQAFKKPVSQPYIKLMALYQTSGQVRYTHEMEVPPTTVNAAFVQSLRALADFQFKSPVDGAYPVAIDTLTQQLQTLFPDLLQLITCDNIPEGGINDIGMGADQPVFASERVQYVGQSIALAVAKNEQQADTIAQFITDHCIHYDTVTWPLETWGAEWNQPVLTLEDAIERNSIFPDWPATAPFYGHIWKIIRHNSAFNWVSDNKNALDKTIAQRSVVIDGGSCQVIESTQTTGGQVHFYMETQSCVALPNEAERLTFHPSSQSPMEMHQTAASVLGVEHNQVDVGIRQVGGGYGGKTEQAKFIIGAAAVAAKTLDQPVRLVMPRDNDTSMIGKRHPYYGQYQVAIDDGKNNPDDKGLVRGLDLQFYGDGGAFYDCSYIVSNCLQTRVDNAYMTPNFRSTLDVCRTNTAPNTAFRSFGDIQGKLISENAIDDAAYSIGMDPMDVREKNLYQRGDVTPFGQALSYCYIREVWQYLKEISDIENRKKAVAEFNKNNKWRKRGIYMLPVKYGSGYNLVQLEQASAMVSVYAGDGSIVINQGGVDMGQGMVTKIEQIASYILNVPMDMIRIQLPKTDVIPNPTSTGGSTGTAYNGLAVKQTCERLRTRLTEFGYDMLKEQGDDWCKNSGIDFWNYGTEGWATSVTLPDGRKALIWQNLISLANAKRVSLVEAFNAQVPGGTTPIPNLIYKPKELQKPLPGIPLAKNPILGDFDSFCGFTYSAACSEVEVDILTGEVKILRSDIMYDMGWSINPALDIGQVEGAFIQGVGYVMTEKLVFEPEGDEQGRLNTVNTWRYKPPGITNVPLQLNVHLFPRDKADNVPENPNDLLSAKEVGEPPLVLAATVFFAIKAAIRASRIERGLDGLFTLDAPATVQEVRKACAVDFS